MTNDKSPEQAAEEWLKAEQKRAYRLYGNDLHIDNIREELIRAYVAGYVEDKDDQEYQRGKAEERARIWEAVEDMWITEALRGLLKQIIFGGGNVER